jgi:hypothetical protein
MASFLDLVRIRSSTAEAILAFLAHRAADTGATGGLPLYMGGYTPASLFIEPDVLKWEPKKGKEQIDPEDESPSRQPEVSGRIEQNCTPASAENLEINETDLYGDKPLDVQKRVSWKEELDRAPEGWQIALVAPAGQGKSLLARMTSAGQAKEAWRLLNDQLVSTDAVPLPIYASLPALCKEEKSAGDSPADTLRRVLLNSLKSEGCRESLARQIADSAHEARVWLWLDGLDEVDDDYADQLDWLLRGTEGWLCRTVIMSRPYGLAERQLPFDLTTEYRLAPFLPPQIDQFVSQRFANKKKKLEEIRSLLQRSTSVRLFAQNPFLLTLTCGIIGKPAIPEDITRGQLYDLAIRHMFASQKRAGRWMSVLSELAWTMHVQYPRQPQISYDDLLTQLRDCKKRPSPIGDNKRQSDQEKADALTLSDQEKAEILVDELAKCRVLVPSGSEGVWIWPHRSFGEYLAACQIASAVKVAGWETAELEDPTTHLRHRVPHWIQKKSWLAEWAEVVAFAAGRLADPVPLLKLLADSATDDDLRHRLALACRCLPEIVRERASGDLESAVDAVATGAWIAAWAAVQQELAPFSPVLCELISDSIMHCTFFYGASIEDLIQIGLENCEQHKTLETMQTFSRFGLEASIRPMAHALLTASWDPASVDEDERPQESVPIVSLDSTSAVPKLPVGGLVSFCDADEDALNKMAEATGRLDELCKTAEAIGGLGPAAATPEYLAALSGLLLHPIWYVKQAAARAVGRIGQAAATQEILAALVRILHDPRTVDEVLRSAEGAIAHLGLAAATPEILAALLDRSRQSRISGSALNEIAIRTLLRHGARWRLGDWVRHVNELGRF